MIQFTWFELTMLVFAGIGWAGLFHYRGQSHNHRSVVLRILADKDLRDKLVAEFDEFQRSLVGGRD